MQPSGDIKNPAKPGESRLNPVKKPGLRRLLTGFGTRGDQAGNEVAPNGSSWQHPHIKKNF